MCLALPAEDWASARLLRIHKLRRSDFHRLQVRLRHHTPSPAMCSITRARVLGLRIARPYLVYTLGRGGGVRCGLDHTESRGHQPPGRTVHGAQSYLAEG